MSHVCIKNVYIFLRYLDSLGIGIENFIVFLHILGTFLYSLETFP